MKKMLTAALVLAASSTAMAENYNNTSTKLTAKGTDYFFSVTAPKTGADSIELGTNTGFGTSSFTVSTDEGTQDYMIKLTPEVAKDLTFANAYLGSNFEYDWGDSYTDNELTVRPYIGLSRDIGKFSPYAEVGYAYKSNETDFVDFEAEDSYVEVGASYALTDSIAVEAAIVESRDDNFEATDKEVELGLVVKF